MARVFGMKGQVATKYGKGTTKRRGAYICGMAPSVFEDKDDPNYKPHYGTSYTERQQSIIDGKLPLDSVPMRELGLLANKAKSFGDHDTYDFIHGFMEMARGNRYKPEISVEDAMKGLQELTPWKCSEGHECRKSLKQPTIMNGGHPSKGALHSHFWLLPCLCGVPSNKTFQI